MVLMCGKDLNFLFYFLLLCFGFCCLILVKYLVQPLRLLTTLVIYFCFVPANAYSIAKHTT